MDVDALENDVRMMLEKDHEIKMRQETLNRHKKELIDMENIMGQDVIVLFS